MGSAVQVKIRGSATGAAWPSPDASLVAYVEAGRRKLLYVYEIQPDFIEEHFNIEQAVLSSGYRYRQVFEVIQNAADAILEAAETGELGGGRIHVRVSDSHLYVGNTGARLSQDGIKALLSAHSSPQRRIQIGRFGLGFKSLLALGGRIELFSRSVSIRFDPAACQASIAKELGLAPDQNAPSLRMAEVIAFADEAGLDEHLQALGDWTTTILRAEARAPEIARHLRSELEKFPREFVLFLPVDVLLDFEFGDAESRVILREPQDGTVLLHEDGETERWLVVERIMPITDEAARKDAGVLHGRTEVPVMWAIPLDAAEDVAGRFWAFLPTDTLSRVPGIVNAPWKIDFGRAGLVSGEYNTFLMLAAAELIVDTIPKLASPEDPGRTLDALPRGLEGRDEPAAPLVEEIWARLAGAAVVPDSTGELCPATGLSLHPVDHPALAERWLALVAEDDDLLSRLVHPSCHKRQRLSRLRELRSRSKDEIKELDICKWLEAACGATVDDDKECLSLVVELKKSQRWRHISDQIRAAKIVLADTGKLVAAQDAVIDGATENVKGIYRVDPELLADKGARHILVELLSVKSLDNDEWERRIRRAIARTENRSGILESHFWKEAWAPLRVAPSPVLAKIENAYDQIKVRCRDGAWRHRHEALLRGRMIPPAEERPEDAALTIDTEFHKGDAKVLATMGVSDLPRAEMRGFPSAPYGYADAMLTQYQVNLKKGQNPHANLIDIIGGLSAPHGWELIARASGGTRARISQHFLETDAFSKLSGRRIWSHLPDRHVSENALREPGRVVVLADGARRCGRQPRRHRNACQAPQAPWVSH